MDEQGIPWKRFWDAAPPEELDSHWRSHGLGFEPVPTPPPLPGVKIQGMVDSLS